jgi:hypothetical protein
MALVGSCSLPPEPTQGTQRQTFVSNKQYNTSLKTTVNTPKDAETNALYLLREAGFKHIQELDWICERDDGEWVVVEVKCKELFTPGKNFPHYGAGLNRSQIYLRTKLLEKLGWRTYLIVFVKGTDKVYGAYLDELERGIFYDTTKNGIRIYPISNFEAIETHQNAK